MWREKGRAAVYEMGGIYLLCMAYYLFRDRFNSQGTEYVIVVTFIAVFALVGIAMILFGTKILFWKKKDREPMEHEKKSMETEKESLEAEKKSLENETESGHEGCNEKEQTENIEEEKKHSNDKGMF